MQGRSQHDHNGSTMRCALLPCSRVAASACCSNGTILLTDCTESTHDASWASFSICIAAATRYSWCKSVKSRSTKEFSGSNRKCRAFNNGFLPMFTTLSCTTGTRRTANAAKGWMPALLMLQGVHTANCKDQCSES